MDNINNILIVGSGENYNESKLLDYHNKAELVIAVDGGYDVLLKHNLDFDILLGDFDSINVDVTKIVGNFERYIYPQEKDYSDSEMAIIKAMDYKPKKIFLFNMTGSYFDHTFANVLNLFKYQKMSMQIVLITNNSQIFGLENGFYEFCDYNNRRVSFFFLETVEKFSMDGFKYCFNKDNLSFLDYSLSNIISNDKATLSFDKGKILLVIFDESYK